MIIDGYNLLHQDTALSAAADESLENARQRLVHLIARCAPLMAKRTIAVFDGTASRRLDHETGDVVELVFSPRGSTADTVIERITHSSARPDKILVVTSDHMEQITVMSAGAHVMSCRQFLEQAGERNAGTKRFQHNQKLKPRGPRLGDFFPGEMD